MAATEADVRAFLRGQARPRPQATEEEVRAALRQSMATEERLATESAALPAPPPLRPDVSFGPTSPPPRAAPHLVEQGLALSRAAGLPAPAAPEIRPPQPEARPPVGPMAADAAPAPPAIPTPRAAPVLAAGDPVLDRTAELAAAEDIALQERFDQVFENLTAPIPLPAGLRREIAQNVFSYARGVGQGVSAGYLDDLAHVANVALARAVGREPPRSSEEVFERVRRDAPEVAAEIIGFMHGVGTLIAGQNRALGAAGRALPAESRAGQALRAFDPSVKVSRGTAAAQGAAEGAVYDLAFEADDAGERARNVALGTGLGAVLGPAFRALQEPSGEQLFHGTTEAFDRFDPARTGRRDPGNLGAGVYVTPDPMFARRYAEDNAERFGGEPTVLGVRGKLKKTANLEDVREQIEADTGLKFPLPQTREASERVRDWFIEHGFDSVRLNDEIAVFEPRRLKVTGPADVPSVREHEQRQFREAVERMEAKRREIPDEAEAGASEEVEQVAGEAIAPRVTEEEVRAVLRAEMAPEFESMLPDVRREAPEVLEVRVRNDPRVIETERLEERLAEFRQRAPDDPMVARIEAELGERRRPQATEDEVRAALRGEGVEPAGRTPAAEPVAASADDEGADLRDRFIRAIRQSFTESDIGDTADLNDLRQSIAEPGKRAFGRRGAARGRLTQALRRAEAAEQEMRARGLEPPDPDAAFAGVKPDELPHGPARAAAERMGEWSDSELLEKLTRAEERAARRQGSQAQLERAVLAGELHRRGLADALAPAGHPGGFFDLAAAGTGVRSFFRRNFTSAGDLPRPVFERKIKRDGWMSSQLRQVAFTRRDFEKAAKEAFGGARMSEGQARAVNAVLNGEAAAETIPEALRPHVAQMRAELDALSRRMIDSGVVEGELAAKVEANMGVYLNRSYRVFDDPDWAEKVPLDVRNKAKALLRSEFPEASNDEVDGMLNELLFRGERDRPVGPVAALAQGSKLGSKNLSILQKRKDIAPEIRALWGEYEDPLVNYARSVEKMTRLIANHEFLTDIKAAHRGEIVMGRALGEDRFLFDRPIVRNGVSYHARFAGEGSRTLEPLNGLYTTPEIKRAFEQAVATEQGPAWLRAYMKVNGTVKLSKTVGSLMTHIRNVIGNTGFATANGHWRVGAAGKAWKATMTNLAKLERQEWRSYYRRLQELGVVDESARAGELQDVIRDASRLDMERFGESRVDRTLRAVLRGATDLYRAEDDVWKVYAFENEVARYAKARGVPREQVEEEAARIVRNTYPTYSLVPEGVKLLRRSPLVGTFVSFPAEVIRTLSNTLELTVRELKDPKLKGIGAQRLAGLMAAASGVWGAGMASRHMLGITRQEDEDVRRFVAPWTRNSNIVYVSREEGGKLQFIDFSYTDPYSYLRKPLIALMTGDDWQSAVYGAGAEAFEPFLGEEILAGKLLDIARNQERDGGRVYNPQDPVEKRATDILAHLWDAVEPGTFSSAQRIHLGITGKTTIHGRSYDPKLEALAVFTGHRLQELDVAQALSFKGRDFERERSDAHRVLTSVATRRGTVSEKELREAYIESERSKRRLLREAHENAAAAMRLGLTEQQVERILAGAGLSAADVVAVMEDDYQPYIPGGRFLESVAESVESLAEEGQEGAAHDRFLDRRLFLLDLALDVTENGLPERGIRLPGGKEPALAAPPDSTTRR